MKKLALFAPALLAGFLGTTAFADTLQSLNQKQLTQELADKTIKTIELVTLRGRLINNAVTFYVGKDGKLAGTFTKTPEKDPKNDTGKWTINSTGMFCATWSHWNQSKPICVFVYKLNNGLVIVNHETKKLETIVLSADVKNGNQLASSS